MKDKEGKSKGKKKNMNGTEYYVAIFPSDGKDMDDICYLGENSTMVSSYKDAIAFTNLQDIIHNVNIDELKQAESVADITIVKLKFKMKYL